MSMRKLLQRPYLLAHSFNCVATAMAAGSVARRSVGHGSRHVQFDDATVAGWLIRSRQPNTSWIGTINVFDPDE
jgi:hypothetical protein